MFHWKYQFNYQNRSKIEQECTLLYIKFNKRNSSRKYKVFLNFTKRKISHTKMKQFRGLKSNRFRINFYITSLLMNIFESF